MSGFGPAGPTAGPVGDVSALMLRLEAIEGRLTQLERNRPATPTPPASVRTGHTPVYNLGGLPVLAEFVFHMTGAVTISTSDARTVRFPSNVLGVSALLTTYGDGLAAFNLLVNGVVQGSYTLDSNGGLPIAQALANGPYPLNPYVDKVQVATTATGTGNFGLVVAVELG